MTSLKKLKFDRAKEYHKRKEQLEKNPKIVPDSINPVYGSNHEIIGWTFQNID